MAAARDRDREIKRAVEAAIRPAWSEILRAKKAIAGLVADGEPRDIHEIQKVLVVADDLDHLVPSNEHLALGSLDDLDQFITKDQPFLAYMRKAWAATDALLDLVSQGLLVAAGEDAHPVLSDRLPVPYKGPGGSSSSTLIRLPIPPLASSYRLAPRLADAKTPWFALDPDLFSDDLDQLNLDRRTRRCISEALTSFRQGLFLACVNLLGAPSEGAWYAAGELLREKDPQLATALDADNTRKVIDRVSEVLRQQGSLRTTTNGLRSTAELLISLRNYGVHPRPTESESVERYLTETSAATLIMETRSYLARLSAAVAGRLARSESNLLPDGP